MTLPVGCAGPLLFNGEKLYLPLATTEGALIASINRGCKVLSESGGVRTALLKDGMTRAPVIAFEDIDEALRLYFWVQEEENFSVLKKKFDATSNYGLLKKVEAGKLRVLEIPSNYWGCYGDEHGFERGPSCNGSYQERVPCWKNLSFEWKSVCGQESSSDQLDKRKREIRQGLDNHPFEYC